MVPAGGIFQTLTSNWVTIVVTSLATGVTLYVSRRYQTNAREERLVQAKDNVLTVVEEHIIDDKNLDLNKLDNLINAAAREHSVPLSDNVTKTSLLEDLELKIERSPHLNSDQKENYTKQIQKYIAEIEENEKKQMLTRERNEIIQSISRNIEEENTEAALTDLEALENEISELEDNQTVEVHSRSNLYPAQLIVAIITVFIIWYFIFNEIFALSTLGLSPIVLGLMFLTLIFFSYTSFRNL